MNVKKFSLALPFCDVSRLFIWFWSFFIILSFWSSSSSKSWKKSRICYRLSCRRDMHSHTRTWSAPTHTIFSAISREVSCLSLILASLSISCCLFKCSFSSSSSSTWLWRSLFSSSSSSAFSSKCLKKQWKSGRLRNVQHLFNQEKDPNLSLLPALWALFFNLPLKDVSDLLSFFFWMTRTKSKILICKRD